MCEKSIVSFKKYSFQVSVHLRTSIEYRYTDHILKIKPVFFFFFFFFFLGGGGGGGFNEGSTFPTSYKIEVAFS